MMAKADGAALAAALAEQVFGWSSVHRRGREVVGKKPDKLGRLRTARVPDYAGDPKHASAIDERMRQIGKEAAYLSELARLARQEKLPVEWATPAQRARAALTVVHKRRKR